MANVASNEVTPSLARYPNGTAYLPSGETLGAFWGTSHAYGITSFEIS